SPRVRAWRLLASRYAQEKRRLPPSSRSNTEWLSMTTSAIRPSGHSAGRACDPAGAADACSPASRSATHAVVRSASSVIRLVCTCSFRWNWPWVIDLFGSLGLQVVQCPHPPRLADQQGDASSRVAV